MDAQRFHAQVRDLLRAKVIIMCRTSLVLFAMFMLMGCPLRAAASSPSADDPLLILRSALAKLSTGMQSTTRFTYMHLDHTENFDKKGRRIASYMDLYDVTYIGGIQYERLVEVDGKPLAGKDLEEEQRRYDQAVRERSALDDDARAKLAGQLMVHAHIDIGVVLTAAYRTINLGEVSLDGKKCTLFDAMPVGKKQSRQTRHYRFWIDTATQEPVQLDYDLLRDDEGMRRGGTGSVRWTSIDGIPVVAHLHAEFITQVKGKKDRRVVADHAYSHYRRFTSTVTILPSEPIEAVPQKEPRRR